MAAQLVASGVVLSSTELVSYLMAAGANISVFINTVIIVLLVCQIAIF
jgi:hypothetical protein